MATITKKQLEEYEQLKRERNNERILTPEGLRLIYAGFDYHPKAIGKHMLETMAKFQAEKTISMNQRHFIQQQ